MSQPQQQSPFSNPWFWAGAGGMIGGSMLNANSGRPQLMQLPPPAPMFPNATQQYMAQIFGNGPGNYGAGPTALSTLNWFMNNGGGPTDYSNLFNTTNAAGKRTADEGRANLMEQYGAQGTRFGSSMANAATDFELQNTMNQNQLLASLAYNTQENATNRSSNIAQMMMQYYREPAMSFYPTAQAVQGGPSAGGSALSTFGSLAMMVGLGLL